MEGLYEALPDKELQSLKDKYPENASITSLIDGILEARSKEAEATKIRETFSKKVAKLASLPEPPNGVYNVYLRWGEGDDTSVEPSEVTIDGKTEMRYPKIFMWIVEINHADVVTSGKAGKSGNGDATRGIGNKVWAKDGSGMTLLLSDVSWRDAIKAINGDTTLLAHAKMNKLGQKEDGSSYILETTASGKKDLESAGYVTTTD